MLEEDSKSTDSSNDLPDPHDDVTIRQPFSLGINPNKIIIAITICLAIIAALLCLYGIKKFLDRISERKRVREFYDKRVLEKD